MKIGLGPHIRRLREKRGLTVRGLAREVGLSPAAISHLELRFPVPVGEDSIIRLAVALDEDPDELLAMVGKVSSEVVRAIVRRPVQMAFLVRLAGGLTDRQLEALLRTLAS